LLKKNLLDEEVDQMVAAISFSRRFFENYAADEKPHFNVIVRCGIDDQGEYLNLLQDLGIADSHTRILVNQSLKEYGLKLEKFDLSQHRGHSDQVILSVVD